MQTQNASSSKSSRRVYLIVLCAAGLLINFLGVRLARGLGLPLFLDIVGSALAGALGRLDFTGMHEAALFQMPRPLHFGLGFSWSLFIPMIVIYVIFQKQFVEGIATSGGKL